MARTTRKTSIYLTEAELEHLAALSARSGRSQAQLVREAIAAYDVGADRDFELLAAAREPRSAMSGREPTAFDRELRERLVRERQREADAEHRPPA